jgi:hypothetical protein
VEKHNRTAKCEATQIELTSAIAGARGSAQCRAGRGDGQPIDKAFGKCPGNGSGPLMAKMSRGAQIDSASGYRTTAVA